MVGTTLTSDRIRSGEDLVRRLDQSDLTVKAALWFYFSDLETWRLMLGVVEADMLGPKDTYRKIQSVIEGLKGQERDGWVSLDEIAVVGPKAPVLDLLRGAVRTGEEITGIRLSSNVINGQLIEEAYIYRLVDA